MYFLGQQQRSESRAKQRCKRDRDETSSSARQGAVKASSRFFACDMRFLAQAYEKPMDIR